MGRFAQIRLIFGSRVAQLMLGFFSIEIIGTLLAPTFIDSAPLFIVAISPGDHHIALARDTYWVTLFAVALTTRCLKYYVTFRLAGDGIEEMRRVGLNAAARVVDSNIARRSWALGVIFLPGMWAAMLCASQGIPRRRYMFVMLTSTAGFVGLSVAAAEALDDQLSRLTSLITDHSFEATLVLLATFAAVALYRFIRLDRSTSSELVIEPVDGADVVGHGSSDSA